jgi:hypothetical protein
MIVGIRLLFAGTTVTIDREGGKVHWREARLPQPTTTEHDMAELVMATHPAEDHRGIGWRGFAVTLLIPPAHLVDVARGKKEERLVEYAAKITEATGLELGWTDAQLT